MGSFIIGGMQGELPTQVPSTGLTIRELILRDLQATIEGIKSVEQPRPTLTNTADVAAISAGTYTGSQTRKYRVVVVTAGVSGVAKYTCSDVTLGTDGGPLVTTITSGVPFLIGSLGATLALTFTGALKVGDQWDVWAGPYQTSISEVLREDAGLLPASRR